MARDIENPMRYSEAVDIFENEMLPLIQETYEKDGIPDMPARREEWNNWTDALCKDHQISDWQYENWPHPPCNC